MSPQAVNDVLASAPFAQEQNRDLTTQEQKIEVPEIMWRPKPGTTMSTQVASQWRSHPRAGEYPHYHPGLVSISVSISVSYLGVGLGLDLDLVSVLILRLCSVSVLVSVLFLVLSRRVIFSRPAVVLQ